VDDRVKLLIERIEKFPEEFAQIEGNFTHLKWLAWFRSCFPHLSEEEKKAVNMALEPALRELALRAIVKTIATPESDFRPQGLGLAVPESKIKRSA
jgi:hypothetical protein